MKKFAIFALVVLALMASVAAWGFSRGEPRVVEGAFVIGGVLLAAGFVLTGVEFFFEDPFSAFGGLVLTFFVSFGFQSVGHWIYYGEDHLSCVVNHALDHNAYTQHHPTLGTVLARGPTDSKELDGPKYFVVRISGCTYFCEMSDPFAWYPESGATVEISPDFWDGRESIGCPAPAHFFRITSPEKLRKS